ncbi:MAG: 16S rRNA (cytosine(967)-C(5))-methyltransferase RsmB [Kiritimatiellales bacterium]|nr:16S rRNA (cytosine(967)-C(5))-methyltransferase RsmB [Kiritimatiellales bacterium]
MNETNSRYVAADIICRWMDEHQFPDRHLARVDANRAFVTEVVNGVIRKWRTLEWIAQGMLSEQPPPFIEALVFTGLYQLLFMDHVEEYAAINETVEAAKGQRGGQGFVRMLNAVLRRAQRDKTDILQTLEKQPDGIRLSYPDFVLKRWNWLFGEIDARKLCEWNNQPPETILRVQKSRITPEELCAKMEAAGIELAPHPYACREAFFIVPRGQAVQQLPGYHEGWFTIQDPATSACVDLLRPLPGERILDACAAPGGKTAMMADRMRGEGELVAMDLHDDRIAVLRENMQRLGLDSVRIVQGDARQPRNVAADGPFDAILLDVPCMNTGVLRRRVDARWRMRMERLKSMNEIQLGILSACAPLLKDNGRLIYSTCSLEPEENENLVNQWVRGHEGYRLAKAKKLFPPKSGTDGAYAALIRRS